MILSSQNKTNDNQSGSREVLSYFLSCKFFYYKGQRGSPQCSASCCSLHLRRDCHMICFIAPKANNHIVDASIITALNLPATKLFKIRFAVVVFFRFRYRERSTNALRFVVAFGCSRISGVHIEKVIITQRRERKPISPCPRGPLRHAAELDRATSFTSRRRRAAH